MAAREHRWASRSRWRACMMLLLLALSSVCAAKLQLVEQNSRSADIKSISGQDQEGKLVKSSARFKRRVKLPGGLLPEFSAPIGNVTALLGRDVRLLCQVENLGHYQVAWLKEETRTILSIDTNIIITNYRIFLIPDEEERKWALHIKDVQESDRGSYQCQLNTQPRRSISGYLEVVVPPSILQEQSSQAAQVEERANVSLQCRASGHPKPTVAWRREDGAPIRLTGNHHNSNSTTNDDNQVTIKSKLDEIRSERLTLTDVDKSMAGVYVCTASNGIPVPVSKRVPIHVKFKPLVSVRGNYESAQVGDQLEVDCFIEAHPKPDVYWTKRALSAQQHLQARHQASKQLATELSTNKQSSGGSLASSKASSQNVNQRVINTDAYQMSQADSDDSEPANERRPALKSLGAAQPSLIKSPISVKHSTIDANTYKLTMSIASLKPSDLGEYSCFAINSNGQSSASLTIDFSGGRRTNQVSFMDQATQGSAIVDQASDESIASFNNPRRIQNPGHRIYDEKYLEAIKARQTNGALSSASYQNNLAKSQQKLHKLKGHDKSFATRKIVERSRDITARSSFVAIVALSTFYLFHFHQNNM